MIRYLSVQDLIKMNVIQIKTYSPAEKIAVKDSNSLDMAVNLIQSTIFGEEAYPSVYEKAAVLMVQIIKKHPFGNANKRTGLMAAIVFLSINGYKLSLPFDDAINLTVDIATYTGDFNELKSKVTQIIERHTEKL